MKQKCECGCNGIPKEGNRFINGHNMSRMYYENNPEKSKSSINWIDGYWHERGSCKQRGLEFLPMNDWTKIANTMHHIDKDLVLFIPEELHRTFKHSLKTGHRINEMNDLVWKWFDENGYKLLLKWDIISYNFIFNVPFVTIYTCVKYRLISSVTQPLYSNLFYKVLLKVSWKLKQILGFILSK